MGKIYASYSGNRVICSQYSEQGRSDTPSNQAFEGVKFITIVNSSDISGISFLMANFLFPRMSHCKCHCRWSIKYACPSFGQQDTHNGK